MSGDRFEVPVTVCGADVSHAGVLFTNARLFDRASVSYPGAFITALTRWLDDAPDGFESQVGWL